MYTKYKNSALFVLVTFMLFGSVFYLVTHTPSLPAKFRLMTDVYTRTAPSAPSRSGLDNMMASGSGIIQEVTFKRAMQRVPQEGKENFYVIDLRESPECFWNGVPIRWYGYWRDPSTGEIKEKSFKQDKLSNTFVKIKWAIRRFKNNVSLELLKQHNLETEQDMVKKLGFHYAAFNGIRHTVHQHKQIDQFVAFVKSMQPSAWLHFHCGAGRGRTTIFLVLYDIIKNAHQVSLKDIVARQYMLGGENVFDDKPWVNGTWTPEALKARKKLVQTFYAYVKDPNGYAKQSWSNWLKVKGVKLNELDL